MLVSVFFKLKNEERQYTFNPNNVLYIEPEGVLFTKDVYRQFAKGEYANLEEVLLLNTKGYVPISDLNELDNVNDV